MQENLEVCTKSGTFEYLKTCGPGQCVTGKSDCQTECKPGQARCNGNELQVCSEGAFVFSKDCAEGTCDADLKDCVTCTAGETLGCSEDKSSRLVCNSNGAGSKAQKCPASSPLCVGAGECVACVAGEKRCADAGSVETCGSTGQWEPAKTCLASEGKPVCVDGGACETVQQMVAGDRHTCALTDSGAVFCWGANNLGQLGLGAGLLGNAQRRPQRVTLPAIKKLVSGFNHVCAITSTSEVYCWGDNLSRQAVPSQAATPVTVPTLVPEGANLTELSAGEQTTCGIKADSSLLCWGSDFIAIKEPLMSIAQLGMGRTHACALLKDQTVWCWGLNDHHQLGISSPNPQKPFKVSDAIAGVKESRLLVGDYHNVVKEVNPYSSERKWGNNEFAQLCLDGGVPNGWEDPDYNLEPSNSGAVYTVGYGTTAWTYNDGKLHALGYNLDGRLGAPKQNAQNSGGVVINIAPADNVVFGNGHTCVWQKGGKAWCWGVNTSGQLGIGSSDNEQLTSTEVNW